MTSGPAWETRRTPRLEEKEYALQLAGKVAIVTGAGGGGSGQAEALRLWHEGVSVVVNEINETGGRETVRLIEAKGGRAAFFRADVGDEQAVRALIQFAETTYGGLDILINNCALWAAGPA